MLTARPGLTGAVLASSNGAFLRATDEDPGTGVLRVDSVEPVRSRIPDDQEQARSTSGAVSAVKKE